MAISMDDIDILMGNIDMDMDRVVE